MRRKKKAMLGYSKHFRELYGINVSKGVHIVYFVPIQGLPFN